MPVEKTLQNINFEFPICNEQYFLNRSFMLHVICLIANIQENKYLFRFPFNMATMIHAE